jgi:hypothetical protein
MWLRIRPQGEAIRAEGRDPDGLAVVTAIDLVRLELSMYFGDQYTDDEPASQLVDGTRGRS